MYSIDGLCPTGHPLGGYGFSIYLSPQFRDAVAAANVTQEQVDRVIKVYGVEWLQKCGLNHYFDPENCGYDAEEHAVPSPRTRPSYNGTGLRICWGEWGPEHITVPGNACGLDIDDGLCNPFNGGKTLQPHNVDSWGQVCCLLIAFTWFAHYVFLEQRVKKDEQHD